MVDPVVFTNVGAPTSAASVTVRNLTPGFQYDFDVIATNPAGSATSNYITLAMPPSAVLLPPSPATALVVISATATSIALTWAQPSIGQTPFFYVVQYRSTGQFLWTSFDSGPSPAAFQIVTGLTPGTSYELQVVANNSIGSSTSSSVFASTVSSGTAPSAPQNVSLVSVTPSSATLTWQTPATGTAPFLYQVQYRVSGQTIWTATGTPSPALSGSATGLNPGTTYDFQVVPSNNVAAGTPSAVQTTATTIQASPPNAPGAPTAWIITPTSVSLTWPPSTSGSAPISYRVQYRPFGTTGWIQFGTATEAVSATVGGLTSGVTYEFTVTASNIAGSSVSTSLIVFSPVSGVVVPRAGFTANQILKAADLDAILDAKLDIAGGAVGPIQITQTATGGGLPAAIALSRAAGGVNDAPLLSGIYTAVMADGPIIPYSAIGMTLTVQGDAGANGPAGNVSIFYGVLNVNATRSSLAGTTGSQHAAVTGRLEKNAPVTGIIPAGLRLADSAAVTGSAFDRTNTPSSQGGGLIAFSAPLGANGADDADLRYGVKILYGEALPIGTGGLPLEITRGAYIGPNSPTSFAKVTLELAGPFGVAGLDLRAAAAYQATILSASPVVPVTAVSVDRALPFTAAGSPASAVTATNPKPVTINGNSYSVVNVSLTPGATSGVLTFSSPISVTDATQGNKVIPVSHTVWLDEGSGGDDLPGDIAINKSGTSRIWYDQSGGGFTLDTGSDRLTVNGTASIRIPVGTTSQRPAGQLGDFRGNSDSGVYEVWSTDLNDWAPIISGSAPVSAVIPGPAVAVLSGTTTSSAVPITWSPPTSGTTPFSYQVQYRVSGVAAWTNWGGPQTATSTTVSGLTPGTRYDFQVLTINSAGTSTSAVVSVTMAYVAPAAPSGVAAGSLTSTTIAISWLVSTSGTLPISYQVNYRVTGSTPWLPSPAGLTSGTSQTVTGLTAATSYDFQVVASNPGGSTASTTVTASTAAAATVIPAAATGVATSSPTSSSLVVSWTAGSTGTLPFSYVVQYRITGTTTFSTFGGPVTSTTETITGLVAATTYDFRVVSTNSAGSATSTVATGTTAANPVAATGSVSGTQTSGTLQPIITAPASGSVLVSNVLALAGITIADAAAGSASGSCTLSIGSSLGTISSTVGGSPIAGSGSAAINYVNTLASCQTAAANLIFTAPSAAAPAVSISITFIDQAGKTTSLSINVAVTTTVVTTGGAGSVPTDATGTTAVRGQNVLNGFGVNTRIDSTVYQTATLSLVENCINYLGGITLLRDNAASSSDSTWWPQVSQATGIKYMAYIDKAAATDFQTRLNNILTVPNQYLALLEGCQEADTGAAIGFAETLAQAAAFQSTIWSTGQSLGLPVIQMSFGQGFNTDPNHGNYATQGDLSAVANYGNIHFYAAACPMRNYFLQNTISLWAHQATPGKPAAITEFGWNQVVNGTYNSVSPATAAAYLLMMIFDAFNLGFVYYIWHSLIDDTTSQPIGLFTQSGTPRPTATAVKNLFTLLSDSGVNALTFTPGKLNYTLGSFPGNAGGTVGGYQTLMQTSDGAFWLALWNEQALNDTTTGADVTVTPLSITLTLGTAATSVTVYDPTNSITAVSTATTVTSLTISLPARVILVKVVK